MFSVIRDVPRRPGCLCGLFSVWGRLCWNRCVEVSGRLPQGSVCVSVATLRTSQDTGRGDLEFPGVMGQTCPRGPCILLPHGGRQMGSCGNALHASSAAWTPAVPLLVLTETPGGPHPPAEEEQRASKCVPDPRPGPAAGASPGGSRRPDPCVPSACRPPGPGHASLQASVCAHVCVRVCRAAGVGSGRTWGISRSPLPVSMRRNDSGDGRPGPGVPWGWPPRLHPPPSLRVWGAGHTGHPGGRGLAGTQPPRDQRAAACSSRVPTPTCSVSAAIGQCQGWGGGVLSRYQVGPGCHCGGYPPPRPQGLVWAAGHSPACNGSARERVGCAGAWRGLDGKTPLRGSGANCLRPQFPSLGGRGKGGPSQSCFRVGSP